MGEEYPQSQSERWADVIVRSYAAHTRPPLIDDARSELREKVADELRRAEKAGAPSSTWANYINPLLDEWERSLGVAGPRLHAIEEAGGRVQMAHRSQASHPLRPFGGQ
jgi:hypothetical protein